MAHQSMAARCLVSLTIMFGLSGFDAVGRPAEPTAGSPTRAGSDWPGWRGPARDGVAAAGQQVPLEWSQEPGRERNILWTADVPGRGHGSPCVAGGRVYLATCDEASGSQSVIAFDASDGRRLWLHEIHPSGAMRKNERSTGASCTPACDGERVIVAFPNDGAIVATALSIEGEHRWQTKVGDYVIHQGYGASPLVHGGLVVVACDNKGGGTLAALDRHTGAEAWRRQRPATPNYSSPVVHRLFGRDQLVMTGCDRVTAYDPLTGETLWDIAGATTECVTTTVTDGERIYSSGGYPRNHVAAIRADGSGRVEWENTQRLYVPSLLCRDGHLFAVLDAGIAICWNAATGEERWKQRLGGGFSSSPVLVGDVILATDETGKTHLFRADPERFTPLGENTLGDECFASPAVCGGRLFMRVATHDDDARRERLVCIGDERPTVAIVIAESEYGTEETLPAFAERHLGERFRVVVHHAAVDDPHSIPGLERLEEADVLLLSVRRRGLTPAQMRSLRQWIAGGRPLVAIRTASHAWEPRDAPADRERWPEFDRDVLGVDYSGHFANDAASTVSWKPSGGAVLTGLTGSIPQVGSLYRIAPASGRTRVLAVAAIDGQPPQPVVTSFTRPDGGLSLYTSLGHREDLARPEVARLLVNALHVAVGLQPPAAGDDGAPPDSGPAR